MSDKTQSIDLIPISDEDIEKNDVELINLWMIKSSGQMYGPYDTESLKQYSASQESLFMEAEAYNLSTENWKSFFQITQFQRRKPKLVPVQSLVTVDEFYILKDGIKKGPISLEKIKEMVESKKIPLNIQVSTDNGESWIKLFEHHEFDRRLEKNKEELPFTPEQNIFDEETKKVKNKLLKSVYKKDEEDAIVGLAFIGNGNDKGQKINQKKENIKASKLNNNSKNIMKSNSINPMQDYFNEFIAKINWKYSTIGIVSVFVMFSVLNSYNSSFDNSNQDIKLQKTVKVEKEIVQQPANIERKPAKVIRAKAYKPVKRKMPKTRSKTRPVKTYKEVHADERYETVDIDDPNIKEELTRQLAGGYGEDELSPDEIEFIEKAERDGLTEDDIIRLENQDNNGYEQLDDFE